MATPEKPLSYLERLNKIDKSKKINVYFIPGLDTKDGSQVYFYAIASMTLHDKMMQSLRNGDIPGFAVIIEKGHGEPTEEVKRKMKDHYGFDHDQSVHVAQQDPARG